MQVHNENEYEDLLSQWSDLESGLGVLLASPMSTQQFAARVVQYDKWMQSLLQRDADVGLYLLFQLAGNSPVGYSASHALVCAVLSHMISLELDLAQKERDSLVRAALTMNIAMTALQDTLANQIEKLSPEQQEGIRTHSMRGSTMLASLGVSDDDWIEVVANHHSEAVDKGEFSQISTTSRLARILKMVDRYAAMISPRITRSGQSASDSMQAIFATSGKVDQIGQALVRAVGLCPPGTYVRMDSDEVAVVVRRSAKANLPHVVVVSKTTGELLNQPRLHRTSEGYPRIRSALPAAAVQVHLNHYLILQMGRYADLGAGE